MKENFCLDEEQVKRLSQLVEHELFVLNILMEFSCLSDSVKLHLTDEYDLYDSILDFLLKRG